MSAWLAVEMNEEGTRGERTECSQNALDIVMRLRHDK